MKNNTEIVFDLHSHVLPVDDGARDFNEALATLQSSYDQGVRYIFATPHSFAFCNGLQRVNRAFDELHASVSRDIPDIHLKFGCEILCSEDIMDDILEELAHSRLNTMGKTKYVLAEFWTDIEMEEIEYCVDRLKKAGWFPIIAHVERYPLLFDSQNGVQLLHEKALFQINAYSIVEEKNQVTRFHAQWLLQERLVDFLGSDTHGMGHRPPKWEKAIEYINQNCDEEYAEKLRYKNAMTYFEK